jgi:hypothetical protein
VVSHEENVTVCWQVAAGQFTAFHTESWYVPVALTWTHAAVLANAFGPLHWYVNWPCGPHSSTVLPWQPVIGPVMVHGGSTEASIVFEQGPYVVPNASVTWSM